nr:hypothetical protein [Tanacetum cinerariifolium]
PVILSGIATLYSGGERLTGQMVGVGGGISGAEEVGKDCRSLGYIRTLGVSP